MNTQISRTLAPVSLALLVIAILLAQVFLFLLPALDRQVYTTDELSSFLAATGHFAEYKILRDDATFPAGEWVAAAEWQRFLQLEEGRGLGVITHDILYWDVHPPLYFWLLHGWLNLFPLTLWVGTLLNFLITALASLVLYFLGKDLFKERSYALLAVAVWLLSPVFIRAASLARQYVLMTFWTILLTFLLFRFLAATTSKERLVYLLGGAVAAIAGLMTHFVFGFVVAGVVLVGLAGFLPRMSRRARAGASGLLGLASLGVVAIVATSDIGALTFAATRAESVAIYWDRLPKLVTTLAYLSLPVFAALFLIAIVGLVGRRKEVDRSMGSPQVGVEPLNSHLLSRLVALVLIPYTLMVGMILTGIFATHTMTAQYVMFLAPSIALIAVYFLVKFHARHIAFNWLILAMIGLGFATSVPVIQSIVQGDRLDMGLVADSPLVVFDRVQIPTLFMFLDVEQKVFASDQTHLLNHQTKWLPQLATQGGNYVSYVPSGVSVHPNEATINGRNLILDQISAVACYKILSETRIAIASVAIYRVQPRINGTCPGQ